MDEQLNNSGGKRAVLPWVLVGVLVVVLIGGGIYAYNSLKQAPANQAASAQAQGQGQARRGAFAQNPAMQAAMQLMRLQRDPQQKLTADQITKVKPILQKLIDTTSTSKDFLQQQADAINAVFTAQQKSFLSQRPSGFQGNNPNRPNGGAPGAGSPNGNGGWSGRRNGTGQGSSFNPQNLYKQVLDSLK